MLFQSHPADIAKNVLCHKVAASCTEFLGASISSDQTHLFVPQFSFGNELSTRLLANVAAILMFV